MAAKTNCNNDAEVYNMIKIHFPDYNGRMTGLYNDFPLDKGWTHVYVDASFDMEYKVAGVGIVVDTEVYGQPNKQESMSERHTHSTHRSASDPTEAEITAIRCGIDYAEEKFTLERKVLVLSSTDWPLKKIELGESDGNGELSTILDFKGKISSVKFAKVERNTTYEGGLAHNLAEKGMEAGKVETVEAKPMEGFYREHPLEDGWIYIYVDASINSNLISRPVGIGIVIDALVDLDGQQEITQRLMTSISRRGQEENDAFIADFLAIDEGLKFAEEKIKGGLRKGKVVVLSPSEEVVNRIQNGGDDELFTMETVMRKKRQFKVKFFKVNRRSTYGSRKAHGLALQEAKRDDKK